MKLRVAALAWILCLVAGAALAQDLATKCVQVEVSSGATASTTAAASTASTTSMTGAVAEDSTIPTRLQRFSVTKILDLTFTVLFPPRLDGDHLIELRLFTPDGELYRSLLVAVTNRTERNLTRAVPGYPHPLPQQPLAPVVRGTDACMAASTSFPVAGTDIVSAGLYGRWRVESYLDGAEQRSAQLAFLLNP